MSHMKLNTGSDLQVDETFFSELTRLTNQLSRFEFNKFGDVALVLKQLSTDGHKEYHQQLAAFAPAEYSRISDQLVNVGTKLVNSVCTEGGFQLTLDWLSNAPERLVYLLLERCQPQI